MARSNVASASATTFAIPAQPTATGAVSITPNEAQLQSSGYSEADSDPHLSSDWQVREAGTGGWDSLAFESVDDQSNLETILATGLDPGTEYEYRVRHTDKDGDSLYSLPTSFTTESVAGTISIANVQDQDGNPIEGATVIAVLEAATATTDADGNAVITVDEPNTDYYVFAHKDVDTDGDMETSQAEERTSS